MPQATNYDEYMAEIRQQVCTHCIERAPEGPPCAPHGKRCGIELHLPELIDLVHSVRSERIDPYMDNFHNEICTICPNKPTNQCPCPLEYLINLAVQAIETVDQRRATRETSEDD